MSGLQRRIEADKAQLAASIADRLVSVVAAAIAERGTAHVVLTGGSMGAATAQALAARADDVDWARVYVWWGDERFLPAGDPERNETQTREALLDALPSLPASNIHPMAASDGPDGDDLDGAGRTYAHELASFSDGGAQPVFDVVMLGMGPDTHVASLFPGLPQTLVEGVSVTTVSNSPKPPPRRISLTFDALNTSREVWLMIAGADKAEGVRAAWSSTDRVAHPASGVHGRDRTIWWLDQAAAC